MARIEKKVWPEYFEALIEGEKTFELRLDDFECGPKDILVLREWNPKTGNYTGRMIEKEVGYVFRFRLGELPFWCGKEIEKYGLQIISLK